MKYNACESGVIAPPGMCGPIDDATIEAHRMFLLAAAYLLAAWYAQGARSVQLRDGRVEPANLPPDEGSWAINDLRATEAIVATIFLGERYTGWARAVARVERDARKEAA